MNSYKTREKIKKYWNIHNLYIYKKEKNKLILKNRDNLFIFFENKLDSYIYLKILQRYNINFEEKSGIIRRKIQKKNIIEEIKNIFNFKIKNKLRLKVLEKYYTKSIKGRELLNKAEETPLMQKENIKIVKETKEIKENVYYINKVNLKDINSKEILDFEKNMISVEKLKEEVENEL